jgi:hypothetical protein
MGRISSRNYVIHTEKNAFRFWDFGIFLGFKIQKIRLFPLDLSGHNQYESSAMYFVEICCFIIGITTPDVSVDRTGTIHKFDPVVGIDYINTNRIRTQISTKLHNLCGMLVYQSMSMEVYKRNLLFSTYFYFF